MLACWPSIAIPCAYPKHEQVFKQNYTVFNSNEFKN